MGAQLSSPPNSKKLSDWHVVSDDIDMFFFCMCVLTVPCSFYSHILHIVNGQMLWCCSRCPLAKMFPIELKCENCWGIALTSICLMKKRIIINKINLALIRRNDSSYCSSNEEHSSWNQGFRKVIKSEIPVAAALMCSHLFDVGATCCTCKHLPATWSAVLV